MEFEHIEISDHAKEKDIPNFQIKNILEKSKGRLFKDLKRDSFLASKGKTTVVFRVDEKVAEVITAYRRRKYKFSSDRYRDITHRF